MPLASTNLSRVNNVEKSSLDSFVDRFREGNVTQKAIPNDSMKVSSIEFFSGYVSDSTSTHPIPNKTMADELKIFRLRESTKPLEGVNRTLLTRFRFLFFPL
jgi:hypothetical protein